MNKWHIIGISLMAVSCLLYAGCNRSKKAEELPGYVYVAPGEFTMGCSEHDDLCYKHESPAHKVKITKGFYIMDTEVRQGEYEEQMGDNPSSFSDCGDDCPVDQVTWDQASEFCKKIGGRLPTSAEWEFAARAGSTTRFYWGKEMDGDYAWYSDNSGKKSHPVAQKEPNAIGLYDMTGNVWEWVQDYHSNSYYNNGLSKNPKGPSSGTFHVLRGGSWGDTPEDVRVSYFYGMKPDTAGFGIGFRCVVDK